MGECLFSSPAVQRIRWREIGTVKLTSAEPYAACRRHEAPTTSHHALPLPNHNLIFKSWIPEKIISIISFILSSLEIVKMRFQSPHGPFLVERHALTRRMGIWFISVNWEMQGLIFVFPLLNIALLQRSLRKNNEMFRHRDLFYFRHKGNVLQEHL